MRQASKSKYIFYFLTSWAFLVQASYAGQDWKILVYMQADNNLAPYAFWDLREMASSLKEESRTSAFVHLDLPGMDKLYEFEVLPDSQKALSSDLLDYQKASLLDYRLGKVKEFDESSHSSQKRNLLNFLLRMEKERPSKNTMLVIWGHGEGWSGQQLAQFGGVALDENPKSKLSASDLGQILKAYRASSGQKLDILAMDACLMQTVEVSYTFKETVDFFIGSVQTQNFKGLPYHFIHEFIQEELEDEAAQSDSGEAYYLAKGVPALFRKAYELQTSFKRETMSSISGKELNLVFLPEFNRAFGKINRRLEEKPFELFSLKRALEEVPYFLGHSRDVSSLLGTLEEYFYNQGAWEAAALVGRAQEALSRSILAREYGSDYWADRNLGSFKAFGVWLPASKKEYVTRIGQFESSALYSSPYFVQYREFLSKLYKSQLF